MKHHKVDADKQNKTGYPSKKAMPGRSGSASPAAKATGVGKPMAKNAARMDMAPAKAKATRR